MPIVFSAKLDGSEAIRFEHVSLVVFYLRQARGRAMAAAAMGRSEEQFAEALLAVILAGLCLEAFANEVGENVLEEADVADFMRCRKKFQRPDGTGSVAWKLSIVFEKKWGHTLSGDSDVMKEVESLFELRNALVHYKLSDSAAKTYLPAPVQRTNPQTGEVMTVIDFLQRPTRFEAPLVSRVDGAAAVRAYNAARQVVVLWNDKAGAPTESLATYSRLPEPC